MKWDIEYKYKENIIEEYNITGLQAISELKKWLQENPLKLIIIDEYDFCEEMKHDIKC